MVVDTEWEHSQMVITIDHCKRINVNNECYTIFHHAEARERKSLRNARVNNAYITQVITELCQPSTGYYDVVTGVSV